MYGSICVKKSVPRVLLLVAGEMLKHRFYPFKIYHIDANKKCNESNTSRKRIILKTSLKNTKIPLKNDKKI